MHAVPLSPGKRRLESIIHGRGGRAARPTRTRSAPSCGASWRRSSRTEDAVLPQLAPQRVGADPERARRLFPFAAQAVQRAEDMHTLHFGERKRRQVAGHLLPEHDLGREVSQLDPGLALGEHHRALHGVLELPHVPGPGVGEEEHVGGEGAGAAGELAARAAGESVREREDVLAALPQRA